MQLRLGMCDDRVLALVGPTRPSTVLVTFCSALAPVLVALGACVKPLPTLPPRDLYVDEETQSRALTSAERGFVEGIDAELQKLGMPPPSLGGYEMNAAAVVADLSLAKLYHGSGRVFAEAASNDLSTTPEESEGQKELGTVPVRGDPNNFLSAPEDVDISRLHRDQHMIARGLPFAVNSDVQIVRFEQHALTDEQLSRAARGVYFYPVYGRPKIGVAILVDGEDNERLYALVLRDQRINMVTGAPRRIRSGGSFELAGQLLDPGLRPLAVGIEGPSTITMDPVEVAGDGSFRTTISLPSIPGLYVVSVGRTEGNDPVPYTVPVFAGVEPTPWPPYPTGRLPGDARTLAGQLARAANAFRQRRGLSALTIPTEFAAFEKNEAKGYGDAVRDARLGDPNALTDWSMKMAARGRAAGVDVSRLDGRQQVVSGRRVELLAARFPPDAMAAYKLAQPEVAQLGLGVAVAPPNADPGQSAYVVSWAVSRAPNGSETQR